MADPDDPHSTFTFVNSSDPSRNPSPAVRTAIRRQAMRDIGAARKRSGNYGKRNLRQLPVFVDQALDDPVGSAGEVAGPSQPSLKLDLGEEAAIRVPTGAHQEDQEGTLQVFRATSEPRLFDHVSALFAENESFVRSLILISI
jgi:hypothetical protein